MIYQDSYDNNSNLQIKMSQIQFLSCFYISNSYKLFLNEMIYHNSHKFRNTWTLASTSFLAETWKHLWVNYKEYHITNLLWQVLTKSPGSWSLKCLIMSGIKKSAINRWCAIINGLSQRNWTNSVKSDFQVRVNGFLAFPCS